MKKIIYSFIVKYWNLNQFISEGEKNIKKINK